MVTRKWAVAGAIAVAGLATVSIYALLHRDIPVSHASSDEVTWNQATLPAAASDTDDSAPASASTAGQETNITTGYANTWTDKTDNGFVLLESPNFDKALTGSIKGDQAGLGDLQNYLDSALGDEPILRRLAGRLLEGLSTSNIRHDYTAVAAASQRVAEGVARAMASAYRVNYGSTSDFSPEKTAMGWDFGPTSNKLPKNFSRVAPNSKEINGTKVAAFDLKSGSAPFNDGLTGVTSFKTRLTDGLYRVLVVSGPQADGRLPKDPFGHLSTDGRTLRMVDATRNMPDAEVRFSSAGINYYVPTFAMAASVPGLAPINADGGRLVKLNNGKGKAGQGELLVTRAKVENGEMTLGFAPSAGGETYIVALMVQNSDYSAFEKDMQEQIAALLSSIETAAGGDNRGTHPGHTSPFQTAFNTTQNGTHGSRSGGGFGSGGYAGGGYASGSSGGGYGSGSSGASPGSSPSSSTSSSSSSGGNGGTPSSTSSSSSSGGNGGTPSSTSSSSSSGGDGGTPSSTSSSSSSGGDGGTPSSTSSSSSSGGDGGTPSSTSSSSSSGGDGGTPSSTSSSSGGDGGTPSSTSSSSGGDSGTPSSTSSSSGGDGGTPSSTSSSSGGPKPQDALQADAGHDLMGNLGDSFFLNGCNSVFSDQTLCDFTAEYLTENFSITWYYEGNEVASGITATLDTSTNPWFTTIGDYILSLEIIFTGGDLQGLASTDFTQLSLNQNATIPVPGILGLFGLGLLGLGYRRRL
ncbi:PEP-CTERM sorting domain-containing protein [Govanella unica]|uniref:Ice-binding protein C-terminal domain-containing protein n=1 Tax=Govanella unica TaxID=2975056 RepID=A0A9X3TY81_9PROT|nr:PEP-CTERM sorting domain-containing protein [Govania unica]MDA5193567.1 hypothetical protein [Govania unica]